VDVDKVGSRNTIEANMPKAQFLETTDREMPSHKMYLFTNYFSKPDGRRRPGRGNGERKK